MKIAVDTLTAKSLYHGMGIYTFNLLKEIVSIAHEHNILIYNNSNIFSTISKENYNIEFRNIAKHRYCRIVWEYTALPIALEREKVDVFWGPSNFLPSKKVCKYVVTIHDLSAFTFAHTYSLLRRKYYQYIIKQAVKRADLIITDSQSSQKDLMNYFSLPKDKIKVINCGVDKFFQPITVNAVLSEVKKKYKLPNEFMLTIGVLEPKKNTERLIQAYAVAQKKYQNLPKLIIAGSKKYGWKNQRIFRLVDELNLKDNVLFTGSIQHDDLPALYSMAKLFILPSLYEGFGLPVIEAMACGTPVITSNTSSLPEVAGDAAVLVNPYDVSQLAQAISIVLEDTNKRKEMKEKGFQNIRRFNWKSSAQEILDVFENVYQS